MTRCSELVSFTFFLAAITAISSIAQAQEQQVVDVDGYATQVLTVGLEARIPGRPVIVLENGSLSRLTHWGDLPVQASAIAPVVAYDRSTVGASEWDGKPGTPSHVTARLWALLDVLDVDPPYILVGWSWGGDLIRHHAGAHPDDIAGLIYIDPAGHSPSAALSVLEAIGLGEREYDWDVRAMEGGLPTLPPSMRADVEPINQIYIDRIEPDYGPVPAVPAALLIAGKRRPPSPEETKTFGEQPYDFKRHFEAKLRNKIGRLSEWALETPDGFIAVARNSGHAVHRNEPELVIDAIRRVVFPDPAGQLKAAIEQHGVDGLAVAYSAMKERYPSKAFDETVLNNLGYDLLEKGQLQTAIKVFELNVKEYPTAWNPLDSLGDAYAEIGEIEKARSSYRKSIELDPNDFSLRKLEQLQ